MTEQFPSWLAALTVAHNALNARYASHGLRFFAAADDANQQLIREPFDGRRSVTTVGSQSDTDLLKLPVYGFYEMLRLLGERHGQLSAAPQPPDLFPLLTVAPTHIGALFTAYDPAGNGGPRRIDFTLRDVPWERVNLAQFRIDATHSNAYAAAGHTMSVLPESEAARQAMRTAQELAVLAPIQRGIPLSRGEFRGTIVLQNFATALLWITPFIPDAPAAPNWIELRVQDGGVVLRWTANREPFFYAYELFRETDGAPGVPLAPASLRAAIWTDAAPPPGLHVYAGTGGKRVGCRQRPGPEQAGPGLIRPHWARAWLRTRRA